ncbi:hypothetical protein AB0J74_14590 [Asanoa sp. NPDC049573]|uniref:hypothetical protein n=1 Tax=Asanoa sp. NPDC049573 TaxID=3155396 RepID=UPI00341A0DA0
MTDLPFVDERHVRIAAPAETVWAVLGRQAQRIAAGGAAWYAPLVGAQPRHASGQPLTQGATLPGFAVVESVPGRRLLLHGRHHFSRYALHLTLAEDAGHTRLTARTDAAFPGVHGWCYRQLVIGSGAHAVLLDRLLRTIRRHAEHQST